MRATTSDYLRFAQPGPALPALARFAETVRVWHRRAQERSALARLSADDLHDFGVTPAEAQWEASQPFWRETSHAREDGRP